MEIQQACAVQRAAWFNHGFSLLVMSQWTSGAPPTETATGSASDLGYSQMHCCHFSSTGWDKKLQHQKAIKMTAHKSQSCGANLSSLEPSVNDKYGKNTVGLPVLPTMLASHLCDSLLQSLKPLKEQLLHHLLSKIAVVQHRSVNWFPTHD